MLQFKPRQPESRVFNPNEDISSSHAIHKKAKPVLDTSDRKLKELNRFMFTADRHCTDVLQEIGVSEPSQQPGFYKP